MLIFAEIKNNIIINKCNFKDGSNIPDNWINVTSIVCNIGDPVVDNIPISKPSGWHTIDDLDWIITPENQILKDEYEAKIQKTADILIEQEAAGLKNITIERAYNFIDAQFDDASNTEETVAAIKLILKKMIPYLLK